MISASGPTIPKTATALITNVNNVVDMHGACAFIFRKLCDRIKANDTKGMTCS